ncbi:RNA guanine-N7 methyltransferase activating subunit-like [Gigantopelta aegis]|uniref:RNA guanine-N7 methyltransferase activating subunit-like n=1 Tax=Gigantopelta aegis TaxID=1735272 RepID=UPI001B88E2EF|nr:RNA guanine-N7 methyltransferase activating subunit-like [Gigantopelta aegis]XP_041356375.1 RNA guanine-N7 methyltransferase activating subunit-like [Gigantopelta aegis]XP_041356376.1 RNA guanine-N7 methyltransferase activating subunit-like [Gigantopelta aegis]
MTTETSDSTTVVSPGTAGSSCDDVVTMYEEMFKNRYTEDDEEYMKTASKPLAQPPCVTGWFTKRRNDWGHHGGRGDNRNWRGGQGHQQNWNRGDGGQHGGGYRDHGGYQDRHHGNQDRHHGNQGHYGGRGDYHSYRGPQHRYRD